MLNFLAQDTFLTIKTNSSSNLKPVLVKKSTIFYSSPFALVSLLFFSILKLNLQLFNKCETINLSKACFIRSRPKANEQNKLFLLNWPCLFKSKRIKIATYFLFFGHARKQQSGRKKFSTFGVYSMPNVFVSSTASRSFSYRTSGVGYGGRSSLLKHVWALWNISSKS